MKKILLISGLILGIYSDSYCQWLRKANFPDTSRCSAFSFSIANKGYFGTGGRWDEINDASGAFITNKYSYLKDFWEFDPSNNSWTKKTDFPGHERKMVSAFSINGKGYAGLGFYRIGTVAYYPNDFWMYDPQTDSWIRKADFPDTTRMAAVCFSIGDKAYMGLGLWDDYMNDFWEYDTQTDIWTKITNYPGVGRFGAVAFSINGKGYVGAGEHDYNYVHDFWQYDPTTNQWDSISPLPGEGKNAAVAFVLNNQGYVGTGMAESTAKKTSDFYIYDPGSNSWAALSDDVPCDISNTYWVLHGAPTMSYEGRMSASSCVINNKAYVGFGQGTSMYDFYNDFYEFTPDATTSITEARNKNALKIYPNPTKETFQISYSSADKIKLQLNVIGSKGEIIYSENIPEFNGEYNRIIDLSNKAKGIYFVEMIAGKKRIVKKIVLD